ncbi:Pentatricopeptide repeat-containing protein, partial [Cucurbita argyrosperma subsp. argyrosperma]
MSHETDDVDLSVSIQQVTNTGPNLQRGTKCVRYASSLNSVLDDECISPNIDTQIVKMGTMVEAGSEPDGVTYCTLIDIHSKSSILDIPWECMRGCKRLASLRIHLLTVLTINCLGKLAIRSCI